jgi:hypothetical protein
MLKLLPFTYLGSAMADSKTTEDWVWFWISIVCLVGASIAIGIIIDEYLNKWMWHG